MSTGHKHDKIQNKKEERLNCKLISAKSSGSQGKWKGFSIMKEEFLILYLGAERREVSAGQGGDHEAR